MNAPGLYVHVPFCTRACPYCDFDFEVGRGAKLAARAELYFAALGRELEARAAGTRPRTVYVGGGTPSALGAEGLGRLFASIDRQVDRSGVEECTVELNPEHVDAALLDALEASGVTRVSLGVQSLGARGLEQLGRVHDRARALAAIEQCAARFDCSADLIAGWPGQGAEAWRRDLEAFVELGLAHISVYALTIEAESAWPKLVARGQRSMPDDAEQSDRLLEAEARLAAAGYEHYEVSSYAQPGARAVHNELYWTGGDYLGLGPSAHSARHEGPAVHRRGNARGIDAWARGEFNEERLDEEAAAGEALWLALRRLEGVRLEDLARRFPVVDRAWVEARAAGALRRGNLRWAPGDRLELGPGRWLWLDEIAAELV